MPRTLQHIQDELLVLGCQDGESEALEALIGRWERRLHHHAWSLTGDAEAARDVSQETWLAIARGIHRLSDPATFGAWAHRIVRHKCADWTRGRQRSRRQSQSALERARTAGTPHPGDDPVARVRAALGTLDPERRAILSMHHLDDMSVNQIARALDIPVGTVKSRLYHAREELRQALERPVS